MSTAPSGYQNPKTNWAAGDVPTASDFNRQEGNISAIESGERTIDPAQAPSGVAGTLRQFLDWFANRIKAITGESDWWTAPAKTIKQLWALFHESTGHKHTGGAGDAPNVPWANISSKPASYTPAAHKASHKTGGTDKLTPADIGAAKMASGTYTGNGTSSREITVGFQPDYLVVIGYYGGSTKAGVCQAAWEHAQGAGASKAIKTPTYALSEANLPIVTSTGFTTPATAAYYFNLSNESYRWVAFKL